MKTQETSPTRLAPGAGRAAARGALLGLVMLAAAGCGPDAGIGGASEEDAAGVLAQAAMAEDLNTNSTEWDWYYGLSADQVAARLTARNARLVSVQVESTSPLRFTVAMVTNTGTYGKTWWWYYDMTASQLVSTTNSLNARVISLAPYVINGTTYFAASLIRNDGADYRDGRWYPGLSASQIGPLLQQHGARLADLRQYDAGGVTKYAVVMLPNDGADSVEWWWWLGISLDQIKAYSQQFNGTVHTLEPADPAGATFNVVMNRYPGTLSAFYAGISASRVSELLTQTGARPLDVRSYYVNNSRVFTVTMLDNYADEGRIQESLASGTGGTVGLYLKQVGLGVEEGINEGFQYDPASSIKTLVAVTLLRQVDAGQRSLDWYAYYYPSPGSSSCPDNSTQPQYITIREMMRRMLVESDNGATRNLVDMLGGFNAVNTTAQVAGMSSTHMGSYPGCANLNSMTLVDAGLLYERVANGTLVSAASRAAMYANMPGDSGDLTGTLGAVRAIVDQEAAALGLTATQRDAFKAAVRLHYKAGSGSWNWREHRAISGLAELPQCAGSTKSSTQFVWGVFISDGTNLNAVDTAFSTNQAEPLRRAIHNRLAGWSACSW